MMFITKKLQFLFSAFISAQKVPSLLTVSSSSGVIVDTWYQGCLQRIVEADSYFEISAGRLDVATAEADTAKTLTKTMRRKCIYGLLILYRL